MACKLLLASSGGVVKKASVAANMLQLGVFLLSQSNETCNY